MSESLQTALERVNYGRYIVPIQDELAHIIAEVGPGKTPEQVEQAQTRLLALMRKLYKDLAKEAGLQGNHVMVFMMATSILSTAWVAFTLRRETSDLSKAPEDRLNTIELLDSFDLALAKVISSAISYADNYPGQPKEGVAAPAPERATS